jgi:hypothetical protein
MVSVRLAVEQDGSAFAWFAYASGPLCARQPVKLAEREGPALDREK